MTATQLATPVCLLALTTLFTGCQSGPTMGTSYGPVFARVTLIVDS